MQTISAFLIVATVFAIGQTMAQQQQQDQQLQQPQDPQQNQLRTTLVITPNANGQGVRVLDQNSGRDIINTNNGQQQQQQIEVEGEGQVDDRVVAGLLEWLENKKKKKKDKENEKKPQVLPIILPQPEQKVQPKIIHIHINNHIQKQKHHHHEHKKHHQKHQGKHGEYEDYHHGGHSWPLLGHHYNWDQDYYHGMSGFGGGHGGGHHDDYSGYESKQIASKVAPNATAAVQQNRGARSSSSS